MAKYIEIATDVEVDVRGLPPFKGHTTVAEVVFPCGRRYGLPYSDIETYFRIVPQVIELSATFGAEHER